jgi:hypothetical protein
MGQSDLNSVPPLEAPERFQVEAVEGWLQLGNLAEAKLELAQIGPSWSDHPEVLHVTWQVQAQDKNWDRCLATAQRCITANPDSPQGYIHRSYALHEMRRTREAWDHLLPVASRFVSNPIIPYNLACYACQLGDLDSARRWLSRATAVGGTQEITRMALKDADLKLLWDELRKGNES